MSLLKMCVCEYVARFFFLSFKAHCKTILTATTQKKLYVTEHLKSIKN